MSLTSQNLILYHGSKAGLVGNIAPVSRERCDFGKGFYMGTERSQPLTLVCNYPNAKLYTLNVNLNGLNTLDLEVGLDWALFVAYNRGKMEPWRGTQIYRKFKSLSCNCDMIVGYIANDRMFVVLDRFFSGEITDKALVNSLSALELGKQYVALTQKACCQVDIIKTESFTEKELNLLKIKSEQLRFQGISAAEKICRLYRREGRFFDEIMEDEV